MTEEDAMPYEPQPLKTQILPSDGASRGLVRLRRIFLGFGL